MEALFLPDVWVRIPLYAAIGLLTEILFTGIVDLISPNFLQSWHVMGFTQPPSPFTRNKRAVGYTFLWMIPCYAMIVVIEPLSTALHAWPLWLRGFIYLPLMWLGEFGTGWIIRSISGLCPWNYSYTRFSVKGLIRWDFAPIWYFFTIFVDAQVVPRLIALTPAIRQVF